VLNVARFGVHQLSEALLAGKLARAQHVLDGLKAEGEALPLIVWVVAEDVRTVLRVAQYSAAGRHSSTFRNELRLWGPREGMVQQAARRASIPALSQAVLTLAQVDKASKGLTHDTGAMDPWTLLSTSFAAFAGK
jgi:DNA polymerase-3 subunit delta